MNLWPKINFSAFTPRGLFTRSLLIIIVPVFILLMVVTYVFFDRHWEAVTRRLAEAVASEISLTAQLLDKHPELDQDALLKLAHKSTNLQIKLVNKDFQSMVRSEDDLLTRIVGGAIKPVVPYPTRVQQARNHLDFEVIVELPQGVMDVIVPRKRIFTASTYIFVAWLFGAAFILVTVAILFMRGQIRPIRRLAFAAESFGRNIDLPGFKPEGAREVRRAARAFIDMKDRLQRQIAQRTEMLAGVSHDLRTPLTRMKLQLALLKDPKAVEELQSDLIEMEQMISGYLDFVRGEGGEANSTFDMNGLLRDCIEQARRSNSTTEFVLISDPEPLPFTGRRAALQRCFMNLISNAQHYGNIIQYGCVPTLEILTVTIGDNGPGLKESEYENVFQAFYRADASRNLNHNSGGVGLGMTIARDIARAHGGDIQLSKSNLGGLQTTITLPR